MTVPLVVLATFSLLAGVLNPGFHLSETIAHVGKPLDHWLEPVFKTAVAGAVGVHDNLGESWAAHMEWITAIGGVSAFLVGTGLAYWAYVMQNGEPTRRLAEQFPALYKLVLDKWRIDELYDVTIIAGVDSLAETSAAVDKTIVDGIIARLTALVVAAAGTILRAFQTGVVHVYAAMMVVGIVLIGWFFTAPQANATVVEAGNDDYVLTAAPGIGYGYRWDADGDGKPEKIDFGSDATLKLHVEPGKVMTVNLEVKNAFGRVGTKSIKVARPAAPLTSL
jgi:NADH-quinone oxidoreductase subunit L